MTFFSNFIIFVYLNSLGMRIKIAIVGIFSFLFISLSAQDYSTWAEIYDFEVGDEFHFFEGGGAGGTGYYMITNIEILDKYYSINNDTIHYYQYVKTAFESSDEPWLHYDYYYESISYTNLDSYYFADSVSVGSMYNGRKLSWELISNTIYHQYYEYYVDGCGYAYRYWRQIDPPYQSEAEFELVYFKKGDEEWGTPNIVVGLGEYDRGVMEILIYPNPASDNIHLSTSANVTIEEVKIYSQIGNEVQTVFAEFNNVDVSKLSPGLYFVEVLTNKGRSIKKLIIQ